MPKRDAPKELKTGAAILNFARQMNPNQLHDDLRECWQLVTARPGISLRAIAKEMERTVPRARQLVNLLLESGTFIKDPGGRLGTLRATVPLVTMKGDSCKQ